MPKMPISNLPNHDHMSNPSRSPGRGTSVEHTSHRANVGEKLC